MTSVMQWRDFYELERQNLAARVKGDILSDPDLDSAEESAKTAGLQTWWDTEGRIKWSERHENRQ